jgi:hypothetical protein
MAVNPDDRQRADSRVEDLHEHRFDEAQGREEREPRYRGRDIDPNQITWATLERREARTGLHQRYGQQDKRAGGRQAGPLQVIRH